MKSHCENEEIVSFSVANDAKCLTLENFRVIVKKKKDVTYKDIPERALKFITVEKMILLEEHLKKEIKEEMSN